MKKNLIQDWIVKNQKEGINEEQLIKDLDFVSYKYDKYCETVFAMKQGGWNVPISNLSEDLHNGTYNGYKETKDFAEYLGKRLVLCLAYFKGKTNKEIEEILEKTRE